MRVQPDETKPTPWRDWFRDFASQPELWVAFAVFTACAAAGYVAGYRDGAADR